MQGKEEEKVPANVQVGTTELSAETVLQLMKQTSGVSISGLNNVVALAAIISEFEQVGSADLKASTQAELQVIKNALTSAGVKFV